ncbi:MAG: lysA 2, partial [Deltaproteobacteria bacterium]|nr:lysA 2 [Deltaproteobacteria bacterium]
MLKPMKNTVKSLIRSVVCSLKYDRFRSVLAKAPENYMHVFDDPSVREKYVTGRRGLSAALWDIEPGPEGQVTLRGVDCLELAERYGTPLYVVDRARLQRNYAEFHESFRRTYPHVCVAYSYKTNPLPGVLMALHEFGADAEVVSGFELWLALRLGVSPDRIVYNGPGKTPEDLELAVSRNVKLINIDGESEIGLIDRLARKYGTRQQVGVRVVTSVGWQGKFGFPIATGDAFEAYRRLKGSKNVLPVGMHVHIGVGNGGAADYGRIAREMCGLAKLVEEKLGIVLRFLDFGGGYETAASVRGYGDLDQKLLKGNLPAQEAKLCRRHSPEKYCEAIVEVLR